MRKIKIKNRTNIFEISKVDFILQSIGFPNKLPLDLVGMRQWNMCYIRFTFKFQNPSQFLRTLLIFLNRLKKNGCCVTARPARFHVCKNILHFYGKNPLWFGKSQLWFIFSQSHWILQRDHQHGSRASRPQSKSRANVPLTSRRIFSGETGDSSGEPERPNWSDSEPEVLDGESGEPGTIG